MSTFCGRSSSILIFLFLQEALGWKDGQSQDEAEINALKDRVKTLSSEKAALEGKLKKLSQSKKGWSLAFDMHLTSRSA